MDSENILAAWTDIGFTTRSPAGTSMKSDETRAFRVHRNIWTYNRQQFVISIDNKTVTTRNQAVTVNHAENVYMWINFRDSTPRTDYQWNNKRDGCQTPAKRKTNTSLFVFL